VQGSAAVRKASKRFEALTRTQVCEPESSAANRNDSQRFCPTGAHSSATNVAVADKASKRPGRAPPTVAARRRPAARAHRDEVHIIRYARAVAKVIDIYGGKDPRTLPRYSTAEAAHYLRLPRATLKTWVHGRVDPNGHRAEPVIKLPAGIHLLSFQNLVEAHVLGAIRRQHGVSLQRVRKALRFVERKLELSHPLIRAKFQTDGVDLFVEELGKLINASSDGQTEIAEALRASLARVEHDSDGLAGRLFPFVRGESREPKVIVVDPRLAFGKPVVAKTGIPVSVIVGRYRAGEDVSVIADDYGISIDQTHDAIRSAIPAAA
jgi:uncharacterized protein (DUF433 family)